MGTVHANGSTVSTPSYPLRWSPPPPLNILPLIDDSQDHHLFRTPRPTCATSSIGQRRTTTPYVYFPDFYRCRRRRSADTVCLAKAGADSLVTSRSPKYSTDTDSAGGRDIDVDVEKRPRFGVDQDPFMLREGVKTEDELSQLRQRKKGGKKVETYQRHQNDVRFVWGLEFYKGEKKTMANWVLVDDLQLIAYVLKSMDEHTEEAKEVEEASRLPVSNISLVGRYVGLNVALFPPLQIQIAVWASLVANFSLCVLQREYSFSMKSHALIYFACYLVYAAISSQSLSLLATGIDSVFDLGATSSCSTCTGRRGLWIQTNGLLVAHDCRPLEISSTVRS